MVRKVAIVIVFIAIFFIAAAIINQVQAEEESGSGIGGESLETENKNRKKNVAEKIGSTAVKAIPLIGSFYALGDAVASALGTGDRGKSYELKNSKGKIVNELNKNFNRWKDLYNNYSKQKADRFIYCTYGNLYATPAARNNIRRNLARNGGQPIGMAGWIAHDNIRNNKGCGMPYHQGWVDKMKDMVENPGKSDHDGFKVENSIPTVFPIMLVPKGQEKYKSKIPATAYRGGAGSEFKKNPKKVRDKILKRILLAHEGKL